MSRDVSRGTFIPRHEWQPGDVDVLLLIKRVRSKLARGVTGCELVDEIGDIADIAVKHPNFEVRTVARQILDQIDPGRTT